eukprot:TRINITY_DN625_c0_g1_i1.p1 TRINITY_DN625_c0_g1~~TRINITY_DN625_c0_g1_i1.p1  ORF type:complete len:173 (-),score=19.09 TRINITY_DN625_c0_g1_i1:27-545(-)
MTRSVAYSSSSDVLRRRAEEVERGHPFHHPWRAHRRLRCCIGKRHRARGRPDIYEPGQPVRATDTATDGETDRERFKSFEQSSSSDEGGGPPSAELIDDKDKTGPMPHPSETADDEHSEETWDDDDDGQKSSTEELVASLRPGGAKSFDELPGLVRQNSKKKEKVPTAWPLV